MKLPSLPLLLLLLTLCVEVSVQQRFIAGAAVGAGIALESAGLGYIAGRASRRRPHHHHRHHGYYGRRRRDADTAAPAAFLLEVPDAATAPATPLLEAPGAAAALTLTPAVEDAALSAALESAEMDAYFRLVWAEDLLSCGLRLVCELGAADLTSLQDDQRVILALFGPDGPQSRSADSPKQAYDAAFLLGRTGGAARYCAAAYPRCPADAEEIMAALRTVSR